LNEAKEATLKNIMNKDGYLDIFRDADAELDPNFHTDPLRLDKFFVYKFAM